MKCRTCARRLDLEKLDYTVGCKHEQMEGFVCLACAFEGVAYWMTNVNDEDSYCEEYVPSRIKFIGSPTKPKRIEPVRNSDTLEWIPCSERLPKDGEEVNVTWVNHNPEPYYNFVKDKPFTATAVYYKGKWYWYTSTCVDLLVEYGRNPNEEIDDGIEITAWMPLPNPWEGEKDV